MSWAKELARGRPKGLEVDVCGGEHTSLCRRRDRPLPSGWRELYSCQPQLLYCCNPFASLNFEVLSTVLAVVVVVAALLKVNTLARIYWLGSLARRHSDTTLDCNDSHALSRKG